jgi:hypothetical protein
VSYSLANAWPELKWASGPAEQTMNTGAARSGGMPARKSDIFGSVSDVW